MYAVKRSREVKAATSVHSMAENAYNDLSYSAKKSNPNLPVSCCFATPAKNVIQDSISVFSFRTTLKREFQVLVSFQFRFPTTLDKITLTSTLIGDRNNNRNRKIENGNKTE